MEERMDEYDIKIADYFDNKMAPGEEIAFMEELGNNALLRARFEDELELQSIFYHENKNAGDEAAKPVATGNTAPIAALTPHNTAKLFSMPFKRFMAVAASVLVIVAGTVIYYMTTNGGKTVATNPATPGVAQKTITQPTDTTQHTVQPKPAPNQLASTSPGAKNTQNKNGSKDTVAAKANNEPDEGSFGRNKHRKNDTANASTGANTAYADTGKAYIAFIKFYTVYKSTGDDPAIVNNVYINYASGKYNLVIDAKDILPQKGQGAENYMAAGYLQLYRGLSYLALNSAQNALSEFDNILTTYNKTQPLYYKAEWYKVLTLLKTNNATKAAVLAKNISQSLSPYKSHASALQAAL